MWKFRNKNLKTVAVQVVQRMSSRNIHMQFEPPTEARSLRCLAPSEVKSIQDAMNWIYLSTAAPSDIWSVAKIDDGQHLRVIIFPTNEDSAVSFYSKSGSGICTARFSVWPRSSGAICFILRIKSAGAVFVAFFPTRHGICSENRSDFSILASINQWRNRNGLFGGRLTAEQEPYLRDFLKFYFLDCRFVDIAI